VRGYKGGERVWAACCRIPSPAPPAVLIELQVILVSQTRNLRFQSSKSAFSLSEEPRDTWLIYAEAIVLQGVCGGWTPQASPLIRRKEIWSGGRCRRRRRTVHVRTSGHGRKSHAKLCLQTGRTSDEHPARSKKRPSTSNLSSPSSRRASPIPPVFHPPPHHAPPHAKARAATPRSRAVAQTRSSTARSVQASAVGNAICKTLVFWCNGL